MSPSPRPLDALAGWVSRPALAACWAGLALASAYFLVAEGIFRPSQQPMILVASVLAALAGGGVFATGWWWQSSRATLSTLRRLGRSAPPPDGGQLTSAVRECFAYPDRTFWSHLSLGTVTAVLLAALCWLSPGDTGARAARVLSVGLCATPAVALLGHLWVLRRSRRALEEVAGAGLSPGEIIACQTPSPVGLRGRLVLFAAITVLTPLTMVGDLTMQGFDRVQAAEPASAPVPVVPGVMLLCAVMGTMVLTGALAGRALDEPLQAIAAEAERLIAGDLRADCIIPCEGEVWAALAAFTTMREQLISAITRLKTAGTKISGATDQLVASSAEQESGADEQRATLTETSAATEELARSARRIAGSANAVASMADQTLLAAQGGGRSTDAFLGAMGGVRTANQSIADAVLKLNKRVQQIGRIVEFINGIADRADLLAVNAELEGTKAGDVGRGFSLVAAEMRRLAESVIASTEEISRLIGEVRDSTHRAVLASEAGLKATDTGVSLTTHLSESLTQILELATNTSDAVRHISLATHQQQTGMDQLAESMADILRTTQESATATRQVAEANSDLSTLARDLKQRVERFTVG